MTVGLDKIGKDMVCELTGKDEYEAGDLSTELDTRVKASVAEFCGKDEYEVGDLSNEIDKRSRARVLDFIGKEDYEFGGKYSVVVITLHLVLLQNDFFLIS